MYFLFKMGIFHCYVCLPEGNFILNFHARSFGVSDLDCKIQGGEHPTRERLYSTYDQSKRILGNCHPQQPISISCSAGFWQALWCQVMNFRFEETGGRLFLYIHQQVASSNFPSLVVEMKSRHCHLLAYNLAFSTSVGQIQRSRRVRWSAKKVDDDQLQCCNCCEQLDKCTSIGWWLRKSRKFFGDHHLQLHDQQSWCLA